MKLINKDNKFSITLEFIDEHVKRVTEVVIGLKFDKDESINSIDIDKH